MLATMMLKDPGLLRQQAYVAGAWVDADQPEAVAIVRNPATGEQIGTVPMCGQAETARAIAAADAAQRLWREQPARQRAAVLRKLYELMLAHQDDLALILTTEQGKPLAEAKGEIVYAASFIEWFAEEARRIYGETIPAPMGDRRIQAIRQPVGTTPRSRPGTSPSR
jgi:succinate-semialdehyde dehydrogenase/glutarate-semialdehyde dehydrogenase